ncbi:MAG: L,D-transpeptidase [Beijerinckiaceae bacterium]
MKQLASLASAASAAVLLTTFAASADPARRGDITHSTGGSAMGGGFIEMLMTGRNPGPGRPAPTYHAAPAQTLPPQSGYGYSPQRQGALPVVGYGGDIPMEPRPQQRPMQQQAALNPDFRQVERTLDPKYLPQTVDYPGPHRPGTVVIDTTTRFLYHVEAGGKAKRYGIGVGRPGFEWAGAKSITRKAEWPDWRPPAEMLKRRPDLPRYMAGGPENPMGARGLYLGSSLYRIHGTNEPHTIGQAVSSGCIRMRNEDVTDLYERVRVGTRVIVM